MGLTAGQTASALQRLYEGGYISYPRTSCRYIRQDMPEDMPALLSLLKDDPCFARHAETPEGRALSARAADDGKVTGHHAIIITENIPGKLPLDEQNLYRMVAGRMLEAFSGDCTKEEADVRIECGGILFEAGYRRTVHAGWKNVHDGTGKEEDTMFPSWGQDEVLPVTDISVRSVETCPVPLLRKPRCCPKWNGADSAHPPQGPVSSNCSSHAGMSKDRDATYCPPRKGWRCMRPSGTS